MRKKLNLQVFAGENNNQNVRAYTKDFKELLTAVFAKESYFSDFFGGSIEALDGIQHNQTAFSVKTSDIPVAVGKYSTDANTAFGTGTGSTSRFGNRTEVIYTDTDVPYSWEYVFHEGIDRHTVNNDMDAAIADRLELQANARIDQFNTHHGKFISDNAGKSISGGASITKDNVADIFSQLSAYFVNAKVRKGLAKVAKVTPAVYNAIIDCGLATTSKNSDANIDANTITTFKGFQVEEIPEDEFQNNEVIYAYVTGIGKAFTGIETARTIESEDFDGVALQGAGKAGEYILPANKAAVAKVTVTGA